MTEPRLKISPPWVTYINKLQAIFDEDPQIAFNVDYNGEDGPAVILSTNNPEKAAALTWLLPEQKYFGNIVLEIGVDCPKIPNLIFETPQELFETAFKGNSVFAYTVVPGGEYWYPPLTYIVFKNCVVQFFNDNLNDPHGVISTLYQDIAAEIFEDMPYRVYGGGIAYCTDVEHKLGAPLGEWP